MLAIFGGALYLEESAAPAYPVAHYLESRFPARRQAPARQAAILNKCQSSGPNHYILLGGRFEPHDKPELLLRLGVPQPDELDLAVWQAVQADLLPVDPPRGVFTIDHGRFHPVDTRTRDCRLAARQLLELLLNQQEWPPTEPLRERLSQQWASRQFG